MSLRDDLLADLADLDDNMSDDQEQDHYIENSNSMNLSDSEDQNELKTNYNLESLTKVYSSPEYNAVISEIKSFSSTPLSQKKVYGPIEQDPEYKLVVRGNELSVKIDREMTVIYKFIRDLYSKKFPELESLVTNPMLYAQTVLAIGNSVDITKLNLDILPPATKMVVIVTASTTNSQQLASNELEQVFSACHVLISLIEAKNSIVAYVESRMSLIAPNLSEIIGSSIAAKLVIEAEGLTGLSKVPSCNLQVIGKNSQSGIGLSVISNKKHTGYIYDSEIVKSVPEDFRTKMLRMVSAKSTLAIRVDLQRQATDGSIGRKLKQELVARVEKVLEASPLKHTKPLPVPFEGLKPRRGGKRVRREKESTAMTELRKKKNRLLFGVEQEEVVIMDEMESVGMLGQSGLGKVRASNGVSDKKIGISKKYQKLLNRNTNPTTSGLATSLAFTPVQGIELSNPKALLEQQKRVAEANARYFSGGFASALPKK
ncbi:hypothetical protein BB558_001242 [Smittium angustum]|uniref:Nop domain-containing protein n=1 Tax=Smittium angustum TaxID=133377 RepID=A0A2U1IY27_SMIAN|nr:hypothetical protein BB558_006405 [Smittium angustum]PWA02594.1 hypothetical protein BB558_001242 [Smittium angustum]